MVKFELIEQIDGKEIETDWMLGIWKILESKRCIDYSKFIE